MPPPKYTTRICPATNQCVRECYKTINKGNRYICDHWGYPKGTDKYNTTLQNEINARKRWNKSIKTIPQKDEYHLKKITRWRICRFELLLEYKAKLSEAVKEARALLNAGFTIGWACSSSCGWIEKNEQGTYDVIQSIYGVQSNPHLNVSLTKAIKYAKESVEMGG